MPEQKTAHECKSTHMTSEHPIRMLPRTSEHIFCDTRRQELESWRDRGSTRQNPWLQNRLESLDDLDTSFPPRIQDRMRNLPTPRQPERVPSSKSRT